MTEIEHQGTVAMTATYPISRELLGKIVDEVFDGAIEDASVIEEIYAVIKKHETPAPQDHVTASDFERAAQVAENYDHNGMFSTRLPKGWAGCRRNIAQAIRALEPTQTTPTVEEYLMDALLDGGLLYGPGTSKPLGILTKAAAPQVEVVEEDVLYAAMRAAWDAAKSRLAAVQQASGLEGVYCNAFRRGWASAMTSPSSKEANVPVIIACDGWFVWDGGNSPYDPEALVDIVLDTGHIVLNQRAGDKYWEAGKERGQQIVAHRPATPAPVENSRLSKWSGWDQSNLPWSEAKHKDRVCYAAFGEAWSMEDAAVLIGFIEATWALAAVSEGSVDG